MNPIEQFILAHPESRAMDRLQDAGIISDNCIEAGDIAKADWERAVGFLEKIP